MFIYSDDGLTVSYEGVVVKGSFKLPDVLTVADNGTFDIDINGEKRTDTVTNEHRAYIQSCLDDNEQDVQTVGNKVCEIYHGMIK